MDFWVVGKVSSHLIASVDDAGALHIPDPPPVDEPPPQEPMIATTAKPCRCGAAPAFARDRWGDIRMLQLRCPCGHRGATLMYTRHAEAPRVRQAAVDGWNLAT